MSGIAGAISDDGSPLDPGLTARLIAAAPTRGFDGTTWWGDGQACLIRQHHATTPQAVGETQPLAGPDGRAMLLLDGRIDNRGEVIDLLARVDCRDAAPDAALVLALWERFGEECVTRLVGDWALAVWQPEARRLFLARSPMGWRPLFWSHAGGVLAFATDARTLLRGLDLDHAPDEGMIGEILSLHVVSQTGSMWRSVSQLEQGGAMRVERGAMRRWHWHVVPAGIDETLSDADHIARFDALFDQAIVAATRSSTPVAAHLSGGLDSSSIVTRATGLHRVGRIDRQVRAISARFPGRAHDETRWSSAVEATLGLTAQVVGADRYSFDRAHRWSADTYHLPLRPNVFDGSAATFRLLAEQRARVLLTGEGGDEWMGGGVAYLADLLRRGRLGALAREGLALRPDDPAWRRLARTAFWSVAPWISGHHRRRIAFSHLGDRAGLLPARIRREWAARTGLAERLMTARPTATFASLVQQQRYTNFDMAPRFVGFGNIVALGEHYGVEMRHPFHDLRLAHFFMNAAPRMLQKGGIRKIVLREAMRGTLAEEVRTRLDKARFVDSIADAINQRLRERPVEAMLPVALGWIDREAAAALAATVRESGDRTSAKGRDVPGAMWTIVALDVWLREATGGWAT